MRGLDIEEKLMNQRVTDPETGCWLWQRGLSRVGGYGKVQWGDRQGFLVHRLAHILWVGPIPEGHHVDHVWERGCRHLNCYNPQHLEAVTQAENNRRAQARKTHCPHGHPYIEGNIYWTRGGRHRICATCTRARVKARKIRLREAGR